MVTGSSRGIGKAIAKLLASNGASICVTYKENYKDAEKVVDDILLDGGVAKAFKLDVCNRDNVKNVFSEIKKSFGGIDVLVNNAGINKPTDFDQITDNDWDDVLETNLKGPFICAQEVIPYMQKNKSSSIINIGSVSGQYGGPRTAHYAASKAALISLGQVVARFGAQFGIRCNTVAAGLIESEMAASGMQSAQVVKAAENIILKRFGLPDEVAKTVLFLASDNSSYITAQTINVNGGLYF